MKFIINREALLPPLMAINNVVERRQTLPILSNALFTADSGAITCCATDMEVELFIRFDNPVDRSGEAALPARKLLDICRALPSGTEITLDYKDGKAIVRAGKSRFTLVGMPANEFPSVGAFSGDLSLKLPAASLRRLIDKTQFAMAHQDVRYYLNGLLLEFQDARIRAVATDGHRLAMAETRVEQDLGAARQLIVPRKGVAEIARILGNHEEEVSVTVGANHLRLELGGQSLTTKLIDGRFPDYERVIPKPGQNVVSADRVSLKDGLSRASILSNEKFKGVRLSLSDDKMTALAHNPSQEEAEEEIAVNYHGAELEIGFNVGYLIDVLTVLSGDEVRMEFADANSSCVMKGAEDEGCLYVVMPMRL